MNLPNPSWPLRRDLRSLRGAHLRVVPYQAENPGTPDACLFCGKALGTVAAAGECPLAYTSDGQRWVCMACFCENKDDFDWPTSE